jgi:hypothetical protein
VRISEVSTALKRRTNSQTQVPSANISPKGFRLDSFPIHTLHKLYLAKPADLIFWKSWNWIRRLALSRPFHQIHDSYRISKDSRVNGFYPIPNTTPDNLKKDTYPSGAIWSSSKYSHRAATSLPQSSSSRHKPYDPTVCPPLRSFSMRLNPVSARRASGLGFVAQPSNPTVFCWITANPACRLWLWAATLHQLLSTSLSFFCCHHVARTWSHSATGSIEPSLLVSPLLGGPTSLRPFALALHLHWCKSSHNLHM